MCPRQDIVRKGSSTKSPHLIFTITAKTSVINTSRGSRHRSGSPAPQGYLALFRELVWPSWIPMAAELVHAATNEKLKETDWMKNIEVCELVSHDNSQGKVVVKSIRKRLKSKNPNVQLFAVVLLEMLMNNCGDCIHRQVIDVGLLPILVKIVKKKNDLPVRERIFLLLDAMQTSLGGASGKFPQYYAAYYDLVSAQVEFPERTRAPSSKIPAPKPDKEQGVSTDENSKDYRLTRQTPDFSILDEAARILDVLRDVLDAIDPQHPEGASDEFTLDLVEQCSFQKQRLMHLIMTCRDEKVVSQAIELNEKLHGVLSKHDALLSINSTSGAASINHVDIEEEEDADCLLRRLRKGKACAEDHSHDSFRSHQDGVSRRPLTGPLCIESQSNGTTGSYKNGPAIMDYIPKPSVAMSPPTVVSLPPPPAKHVERERFFMEKHLEERPGLSGHIRGLSLHSQDGSSSCGSSSDPNDRSPFALQN